MTSNNKFLVLLVLVGFIALPISSQDAYAATDYVISDDSTGGDCDSFSSR